MSDRHMKALARVEQRLDDELQWLRKCFHAANALAEAVDALCQAIDEYTIEVGNAERGSADQGELYERREAAARASRQYREVSNG